MRVQCTHCTRVRADKGHVAKTPMALTAEKFLRILSVDDANPTFLSGAQHIVVLKLPRDPAKTPRSAVHVVLWGESHESAFVGLQCSPCRPRARHGSCMSVLRVIESASQKCRVLLEHSPRCGMRCRNQKRRNRVRDTLAARHKGALLTEANNRWASGCLQSDEDEQDPPRNPITECVVGNMRVQVTDARRLPISPADNQTFASESKQRGAYIGTINTFVAFNLRGEYARRSVLLELLDLQIAKEKYVNPLTHKSLFDVPTVAFILDHLRNHECNENLVHVICGAGHVPTISRMLLERVNGSKALLDIGVDKTNSNSCFDLRSMQFVDPGTPGRIVDYDLDQYIGDTSKTAIDVDQYSSASPTKRIKRKH